MAETNNGSCKSSWVTLVKFMLFVHGLRLSFGQFDPLYVAVVKSPVATTGKPTIIEVYKGAGDLVFDKAALLNARGSEDDQMLMYRHNSPRVPTESLIDTGREPATLTLPADSMTPADRSGIYTITVTENGQPETIWRVIITNENALVRAVDYSTVASSGDNVSLSAETVSTSVQDLRWRRDGVWHPFYGGQGCNSSLSCGDDYAAAGSNVVFECFKRGRYLLQDHAIMNVVVRECGRNKWGPPDCANYCQPCINGGICSDLTGWCLCPPGFSGDHCENVHGRNVFGQNAEYSCEDSGVENSTGCQGAMICYPNPFGCICPAGYTGIDCMKNCSNGKFGANCKQKCRCKDNSLCASDTGVCEDGKCEDGWFGVNCQLTVPKSPRNVNITDKNQSSLTIEWEMPENGHGIITYYKLQFRAIEKLYDRQFVLGQEHQSMNVSNQGENSTHVLTKLEPSTFYEMNISAFTIMGGVGDIVTIKARTDLFTDLKVLTTLPKIDFRGTTANLTLPALDQQYASAYYIRIQIMISANRQQRDINGIGPFSQNPDHYITAEVEKNEQELEFTIGDGETYGDYFNAPLQEEANYNAYFGIGSKAGEDVFVAWSDPIAFGTSSAMMTQLHIPVVIIAVLVAVIIILVLLGLCGFVYCRRSPTISVDLYHEFRSEGTNGECNTSFTSEEKQTETNAQDKRSYINGYHGETSSPPVSYHVIKISDLPAYVRQKRQNSENNFLTEFETLPTDQLNPWEVAEKPENKIKNRYGNIIPYDNSRVVLEIVEGDPHSDYINASYIDEHIEKRQSVWKVPELEIGKKEKGYMTPKKFIASQGPSKPSTIDFWRMVWQKDVTRIVMLTSLFEGKKQQCAKYWSDEHIVLGELLVKCEKLEKHSKYSHRTFYVSLKHGGESKRVEHFHFSDWKDMKVPEFLDPTLEFLSIVRKDYTERGGCTIVHCSAGVGRTGTYITLDVMLDMGQAEEQINVYEFVKQMRHRRIQSVQVKEQYEFIFDTLVKHFYIGRTTMYVASFRNELDDLNQVNSATGKTFIMDQYKKLGETTCVVTPLDVREGSKKENEHKNRSSKLLPVETHRPILMTAVEDGKSNYINATFLSGYEQRDFFIATQMPLKNTIADFWRLVWDYNCNVIIMLNSLENKNEQYWPDSSPVTFSPFTVVPLSSDYRYKGDVRLRKMEVYNTELQKNRTAHQIQCIKSPNHEVSTKKSSEILLNCTHLLKELCSESTIDRVLVHCIDGVEWTGIFCGLVAALDQARTEQKVDIFQLVANMRKAQPLMITNLEQYQFIFDSVLLDLESDGNTYQNV